MEVGSLGFPEVIVLLIAFLIVVGPPVVVIVALVLYFNRRKKSKAALKKCAFCGYSIQVEATVCQFCGREVGNEPAGQSTILSL